MLLIKAYASGRLDGKYLSVLLSTRCPCAGASNISYWFSVHALFSVKNCFFPGIGALTNGIPYDGYEYICSYSCSNLIFIKKSALPCQDV